MCNVQHHRDSASASASATAGTGFCRSTPCADGRTCGSPAMPRFRLFSGSRGLGGVYLEHLKAARGSLRHAAAQRVLENKGAQEFAAGGAQKIVVEMHVVGCMCVARGSDRMDMVGAVKGIRRMEEEGWGGVRLPGRQTNYDPSSIMHCSSGECFGVCEGGIAKV